MRLLLDEMIGPAVARALVERGTDAEAVVEQPDLRSQPDDVVLAVAADEGRLVITANIADFARLHHQWAADGRSHAGILLVGSRAFPSNRGFVGALVTAVSAAADAGTLPRADGLGYLRPA